MASPTNVASLIEQHGTTRIAEVMRLPISTVHTWKRLDAIPGRKGSVLHDMRVRAFEDAIKVIAASKHGAIGANGRRRKGAK